MVASAFCIFCGLFFLLAFQGPAVEGLQKVEERYAGPFVLDSASNSGFNPSDPPLKTEKKGIEKEEVSLKENGKHKEQNTEEAEKQRATLWSHLDALVGRDGHPSMIRPENDQRKMELFSLPNGVRAVAFEDPKAVQSGFACAVTVGSMSDPPEFPGLSHFLEHMLFLGTERFPGEGDFDGFLSQFGGQNNAFTANERTVFMAALDHKGFPGGVERFASLFEAPLLLENSGEREVNAVNAEHTKNIPSAAWRVSAVLSRELFRDHPLGRFSTGTRETLWEGPRKRGLNTTEALREHWKKNYCAPRLFVATISKTDLEKQKELVRTHFGKVSARPGDCSPHPPSFEPVSSLLFSQQEQKRQTQQKESAALSSNSTISAKGLLEGQADLSSPNGPPVTSPTWASSVFSFLSPPPTSTSSSQQGETGGDPHPCRAVHPSFRSLGVPKKSARKGVERDKHTHERRQKASVRHCPRVGETDPDRAEQQQKQQSLALSLLERVTASFQNSVGGISTASSSPSPSSDDPSSSSSPSKSKAQNNAAMGHLFRTEGLPGHSPSLTLAFPIPPLLPLFSAKPAEFACLILSWQGKDSLETRLRRKGLAHGLDCGTDETSAGGTLQVSVDLTERGSRSVGRVLQMFFGYLGRARALLVEAEKENEGGSEAAKRLFGSLGAMAEVSFQTQDPSWSLDVFDVVANHAENLSLFPEEELLHHDFDWSSWNPEVVSRLLSESLHPSRLVALLYGEREKLQLDFLEEGEETTSTVDTEMQAKQAKAKAAVTDALSEEENGNANTNAESQADADLNEIIEEYALAFRRDPIPASFLHELAELHGGPSASTFSSFTPTQSTLLQHVPTEREKERGTEVTGKVQESRPRQPSLATSAMRVSGTLGEGFRTAAAFLGLPDLSTLSGKRQHPAGPAGSGLRGGSFQTLQEDKRVLPNGLGRCLATETAHRISKEFVLPSELKCVPKKEQLVVLPETAKGQGPEPLLFSDEVRLWWKGQGVAKIPQAHMTVELRGKRKGRSAEEEEAVWADAKGDASEEAAIREDLLWALDRSLTQSLLEEEGAADLYCGASVSIDTVPGGLQIQFSGFPSHIEPLVSLLSGRLFQLPGGTTQQKEATSTSGLSLTLSSGLSPAHPSGGNIHPDISSSLSTINSSLPTAVSSLPSSLAQFTSPPQTLLLPSAPQPPASTSFLSSLLVQSLGGEAGTPSNSSVPSSSLSASREKGPRPERSLPEILVAAGAATGVGDNGGDSMEHPSAATKAISEEQKTKEDDEELSVLLGLAKEAMISALQDFSSNPVFAFAREAADLLVSTGAFGRRETMRILLEREKVENVQKEEPESASSSVSLEQNGKADSSLLSPSSALSLPALRAFQETVRHSSAFHVEALAVGSVGRGVARSALSSLLEVLRGDGEKAKEMFEEGGLEKRVEILKAAGRVLPQAEERRGRRLRLSQRAEGRLRNPIEGDTSSALVVLWQRKNVPSDEERATLGLLDGMIQTPVFNFLRTDKQLGYIVSGGLKMAWPSVDLSVVVQGAAVPPDEAEEYVGEAMTRVGLMIQKIDDATLENHRASLLFSLREEPKTMGEEISRTWGEIQKRSFCFGKRKRLAHLLEERSLPRLRQDLLEALQLFVGPLDLQSHQILLEGTQKHKEPLSLPVNSTVTHQSDAVSLEETGGQVEAEAGARRLTMKIYGAKVPIPADGRRLNAFIEVPPSLLQSSLQGASLLAVSSSATHKAFRGTTLHPRQGRLDPGLDGGVAVLKGVTRVNAADDAEARARERERARSVYLSEERSFSHTGTHSSRGLETLKEKEKSTVDAGQAGSGSGGNGATGQGESESDSGASLVVRSAEAVTRAALFSHMPAGWDEFPSSVVCESGS